MSALFSPLKLRALEFQNRLVVSPMCQYSAVEGCATDWHLVHWGQLLQTSAALMCIEATAVSAASRISPGDLGLYDDATEAALGDRLARARRQAPPMPVGLQLAHAGRKASSRAPWDGGTLIPLDEGGWPTTAPSAVPHSEDERAPIALDVAALEETVADFVATTRRAERIGIDALEVHMAHGYLLHQFLSPLANHRDDRYGGSFDDRVRFPLEVFAAVRAVWPEGRPLGVRVSATDWVEGGWTPEETVELARRLKALGCDWIDISSGGVSPRQKIPLGPGYQLPFAREVRRATGLTTMAVGLITDPVQAETIIATGEADLIAMARAFLWNPRWVWHAAAQLRGTVHAPQQYWRAPPRNAPGVFGDTTTGQR
ncbi:MAG: NADH:flavin oxidoreductase/NADH oxidase [Casimicrobiaceae bacterium]